MKSLIFGWAVALAAPAWAQDLRSINETAFGIEDNAGATAYMSSRCGGFYRGVLMYSGQALPEDMRQEFQVATTVLTTSTAYLRIAIAESADPSLKAPVPSFGEALLAADLDITRFAHMYSGRFGDNYVRTGDMMKNDVVATEDLRFCPEIYQRMSNFVNERMSQ